MSKFTWSDHIEELVEAGVLMKTPSRDGNYTITGYEHIKNLDLPVEVAFDLIEYAIIKRLDEKLLAVNQFIDNDGQRKFAVEFYEVDWADYETVELGGKHLTDYSTRPEALYSSLPLLRKEEK